MPKIKPRQIKPGLTRTQDLSKAVQVLILVTWSVLNKLDY